MLDTGVPANIISIIYPSSQTKVRFHRHTDNGSIWIVAADICNILNLTNTSYVASKYPNAYKHTIETTGGKQKVIWLNEEDTYNLCRENNAINLINWLRFTILNLPNNFVRNTYTFNDPVVIERSTLSKLLDLVEELHMQNVI